MSTLKTSCSMLLAVGRQCFAVFIVDNGFLDQVTKETIQSTSRQVQACPEGLGPPKKDTLSCPYWSPIFLEQVSQLFCKASYISILYPCFIGCELDLIKSWACATQYHAYKWEQTEKSITSLLQHGLIWHLIQVTVQFLWYTSRSSKNNKQIPLC